MDKSISLEDYCNQFTKEEVAKANKLVEMVYPPNQRIFNTDIHNALICALEMARWKNNQLSGTLVNVDEVREGFMNTVYNVLSDDPTNDRANDIINAFDSLPTTKYGITAQVLKDCADLINSTCYEEGTGISDNDIEYTIKVRGLK